MKAIIKITVREMLFRLEHLAVHGIGLLSILLFGVFYLSDSLSGIVLSGAAEISPDAAEQPREILVSAMFFFSEIFIVIIAFFTIPLIITRDEQNKILPLFLSKPLRRWQYFLGKYIGGTLYLCISFGVFAVLIFVITLLQSPSLYGTLILSTLFVMLKIAVLSALIMGLGTRITGMAGAVAALMIYIAGHYTFYFLIWSYTYSGAWVYTLKTLFYILPDFTPVSSWSIISAAVENYSLNGNYILWFIKHICIYIPAFIVLGMLSFNKKQL